VSGKEISEEKTLFVFFQELLFINTINKRMPITAIPAKNVENRATWIQKKMDIPGVVSILLIEQSFPRYITTHLIDVGTVSFDSKSFKKKIRK
jgi:hypothetical protein